MAKDNSDDRIYTADKGKPPPNPDGGSAPPPPPPPPPPKKLRESNSDRFKRSVTDLGMKHGGSVKSSASRRADGIASRGKTKGRMI